MKKIDFDSLNVGDTLPELTKEPITQLQLIRYAGASGDFNQIHTVEKYAKEAGLDGTIAHGMLVMGMLGQMITNYAGVGNVKKYGVSFKAMTKPGDVLTASAVVKKKYEENGEKLVACKVSIADQTGDVKADGKAILKAK